MSIAEDRNEQLRRLEHNDHRRAFQWYLRGARHSADKHQFLRDWVAPTADDVILECGSSSGKTCIDLTRFSDCRALGVDFDDEAVRLAEANRDEFFPELGDRCRFVLGDLTKMTFDSATTKVLMPDFSEHVPDDILAAVLDNIRRQLPNARLYVYTPLRSHLFERMRHANFILRNPSGHINVKTERELLEFLRRCGWRVLSSRWRPSHVPAMRHFERLAGWLPLVGRLFRRRVAVLAEPEVS